MSAPTQEDIDRLISALHYSVEFVGYSTLPPIDGWSWYDAMKKYNPELAARHLREYEAGRYPK